MRSQWAIAVFCGIAAAIAGSHARAQPESTLVIPDGQLELARLIDLTAQQLELNIVYDASAVRGSTTMRVQSGLSGDELWELLHQVLASRNFTTVRMPGKAAYSVVKISEAAGLARVEPPDEELEGPEPGFRSIVVPTIHRPAHELVEPLSKLVSKSGGSVTELGTSRLLIADLSSRIQPTLNLLADLDLPSPDAVIEEMRLSNLSGVQMSTLIKQILTTREQAENAQPQGDVLPAADAQSVLIVAPESRVPMLRALIDSLDRREHAETITYAAAHFPAEDVSALIEQSIAPEEDDRWRLVVDHLTGSLIVTATPAQHERIRSLIERLDAAPVSARRPVRSFVIRNRSVNEVRRIIEDLIAAGAIETGADPSDRETERPSQAASHSPDERPLVLTVDEGTNTLIAVGEPRLLAQVESLLESLDVRQAQVMLEVLMVTLSESDAFDLGVEIERITGRGETQFRLSSLFGLGASAAEGIIGAPTGVGFTGVALNPRDFTVLVRALQTITDGRGLSMPKLLVGNNQQATLDAVVQQPFASVNASNTVSTTSFGGTQDAGTVVTIQPQIAEGDHLLLDYSVSLSSFVGGASDTTLPPPRQQNSVRSVATIPDGYTVVVGGIEIRDESKGTSQVPLLGDIPILGEAFKSRSNSSTRSRFYVFIRANIQRHNRFEDLKYISKRDIETAGIDDGWPKVEPRLIP